MATSTDELVAAVLKAGEGFKPLLEWLNTMADLTAKFQDAANGRPADEHARITAANVALASMIAVVSLQAAETAQRIYAHAAPKGRN